MTQLPNSDRTFLFLQGPHGPFFARLAEMLCHAGAKVLRVGFNAGDAAFWRDSATYIPFDKPQAEWPDTFRSLIEERKVTDIVLYGDVRSIHASAVEIANAQGLNVHVFEEGYMRPYWITYERGGSNGHSRLMEMTVKEMREALAGVDQDAPLPPAKWGDMRQHVFYGALYHWHVMFRNGAYRNFRAHRDIPVAQEFRLYVRRLLLMPAQWLERVIATARVRRGGFPYHVVLLQLAHDSSFQAHSSFDCMRDFLETVIDGFAKGAPRHHHLVFKAHPLEDGRVPVRADIRALAKERGIEDRVHYLRGGKLAALLNDARSAVTVNSTAAQQVLWRGMALRVFGRAVYDKPEFVSTQPLPEFYAQPTRPDLRAYKDYRRYLLETSQVGGGFYSAQGRRQVLRQVVDMMLMADDPYDALLHGTAAPRQHLRVVH